MSVLIYKVCIFTCIKNPMCVQKKIHLNQIVNASMTIHDDYTHRKLLFLFCVQCRLTKFVPCTELDFTIEVNVQISKLANSDFQEYSLFSCS